MPLQAGGHPAFLPDPSAISTPSRPYGWAISIRDSNNRGPELMTLRLQPRTDIVQQPAVQGQRDSRPVPILTGPLPLSLIADNKRLALAID